MPTILLFEPFATKLCVAPELFTIPTPLIFRVVAAVVKVNALGLELNTMLSRVTGISRLMPVVLELPKVATSVGPLGTVAGVQFVAVLQSPLVGLRFQVALPARLVVAIRRETRADFMPRSQQKSAASSS
jgi:hypothetical protein